MSQIITNPYLPQWEYVPDGEPHVFADRIYIYGSHDRSHGTTFCMEDYVCWSAPVDDLSDWRCEGVIWKKTDDPDNHDPVGYLYAPDVAQGPDGRFYLYYFYTASNTRPLSIGVAVCDTPAGHYSYYGKIQLEDTKRFIFFDPAVFVDDDKRVWLYYGSAFQMNKDVFKAQGGAVVELAKDMKTILSKPKLTVPNLFHQKGTGFEGHAFFEASSMRKINGTYYFIYSSMATHELCYATSNKPDGPFRYGGVLVSNRDIGVNCNKKAMASGGNNHGSIECINGQWYVFYHRHTQGTSYSRQGCAEPITIESDGSIRQVELTSSGLNHGPLPAKGPYPAAICCHIWDQKRSKKKSPVCIDEEQEGTTPISFVSNIKDGSCIGFKYFRFDKPVSLTVRWRVSLKDCSAFQTLSPDKCKANGILSIHTAPNQPPVAQIPINSCAGDWQESGCSFSLEGKQALYFSFCGKGAIDILEICFL